MRLKSQLTSPTVAVDRNVNKTDMDAIRAVNARIEEIEKLGTDEALADIAEIADLDFTSILESAETVDNLTIRVVETLPAGEEAVAELVGDEIQLRIPRGVDGANGVDGYTPVKGVDYVDGTRGRDAYESAVASGYNGTEVAWLLSLRGEDGIDGSNGIDGQRGYAAVPVFTYNNTNGDIEYSIDYFVDSYSVQVDPEESTEW